MPLLLAKRFLSLATLGLLGCAQAVAQTNACDYEYQPVASPPAKPSTVLPYGAAGLPEQFLRWIFEPAQWMARGLDRARLNGWGTSLLSAKKVSSGFFPLMGYRPAQGFAAGAGYFDDRFLGRSQSFEIYAEASTEDAQRGTLTLSIPFSSSRLELDAVSGRDGNSEFFGFGNRSSEKERSEFELLELTTRLRWQSALCCGLRLDLGLGLRSMWFDADGGSEQPRIDKRFPLGTIPGFQQDPSLFEITAALSHRFPTNATERTTRISFDEEIGVSRFETLSAGEFDFLSYWLEAAAQIPLGKPRRELHIRIRWDETVADGGNEVPFTLQPALGENSDLRGFAQNRFRGKASALTNLEYRFPTWPGAQGLVFYDLGRVFGGADGFNWDRWRWSAGLGAAIDTPSGFALKIQVGCSAEGVQPVIVMTRKF